MVLESAPVSAGLTSIGTILRNFWQWIVGGTGVSLFQRLGNCSDRAQSSGIDPNKLHHIFGLEKHQLGSLAEQMGSREAAFNAIQAAGQSAATAANTTSGLFETVAKVGGMDVWMRGYVIEGVFRLGSASASGIGE